MKKIFKFKNIFLFFVLIGIAFFAVCEFNIINAAENAVAVKSDAAVILGYGLDDGYNPDSFLTSRLEAGLELYEQGMCDYIVVTGKQGPTDNIAVATAMKNWLTGKGVESGKIIVEDKAGNTYENLKYTAEIAEPEINSIIIVTNSFHIYRSEIISEEFFTEVSAYPSESEKGVEQLYNYIKEPLSLIKYYIKMIFV